MAVAAAAVLKVEYAGEAQAQARPHTTKDVAMAGNEILRATISVEHVTITSNKPFEAVRADLESQVPHIDTGISVLLRYGEAERARRELERASRSFDL